MNYEEKLMDTPTTQAEHLSIATQFSNEMMDRFSPEALNEIVKHIRQMFVERRQIQIREMEEKIKHLQESLNDI